MPSTPPSCGSVRGQFLTDSGTGARAPRSRAASFGATASFGVEPASREPARSARLAPSSLLGLREIACRKLESQLGPLRGRARHYKEPAALKRLNTSLDSAQKALKDLQDAGGAQRHSLDKSAAQGTRQVPVRRAPGHRQVHDRAEARLRSGAEGREEAGTSATEAARRAIRPAAAARGRVARPRRARAARSPPPRAAGPVRAGARSGGSRTRASGSRSTRKSS